MQTDVQTREGLFAMTRSVRREQK